MKAELVREVATLELRIGDEEASCEDVRARVELELHISAARQRSSAVDVAMEEIREYMRAEGMEEETDDGGNASDSQVEVSMESRTYEYGETDSGEDDGVDAAERDEEEQFEAEERELAAVLDSSSTENKRFSKFIARHSLGGQKSKRPFALRRAGDKGRASGALRKERDSSRMVFRSIGQGRREHIMSERPERPRSNDEARSVRFAWNTISDSVRTVVGGQNTGDAEFYGDPSKLRGYEAQPKAQKRQPAADDFVAEDLARGVSSSEQQQSSSDLTSAQETESASVAPESASVAPSIADQLARGVDLDGDDDDVYYDDSKEADQDERMNALLGA